MEELSRELRDRTLQKLGLPGPPPLTLEGLNRLQPAITLSFVRDHFPLTDAQCAQRLLDGLRKAGLPE